MSGNERNDGGVDGENVQQPTAPNLQIQALMGEIRRMLRVEMETVHERLDRVEEVAQMRQTRQTQNLPTPTGRDRIHQRGARTSFNEGETDYYDSHSSNGNRRRPRPARDRVDDNLGNIKLKIPTFYGKNDPDTYLEWEKKIELVFDCQNYSELKKVRIAATEFCDYAINWWDQLVTSRRRNGENPIETWTEMKAVMRRRFVPSHYHRELHQKLRRLTQGNRSVEDYFQEMETLMIKANIDEDREATMARFLNGLNREIQDKVEMQHYVELEDMLHKAILFEQQLRRRGNTRHTYGQSSSTIRPSYPKKEERTAPKPSVETKPPTIIKENRGKAESSNTRNRDVQCFKCHGRGHYANECPNRRVMVLMDNGEFETEEEVESDSTTPKDEDSEEFPAKGELLVVKRSLSVQAKVEKDVQRENIFHTRCHIQDKVCSLIIDGGSCTNVASVTLVQKLGLVAQKHPKPYKLNWLNDSGEMKVSRQVLVTFRIGKYEDEVLFDVLPMQASHILLGRPWQSDRRVKHDGYTNKYSFEHKGRNVTLIPLTPQEVYQDQFLMKQRDEQQMSD